MQKIIDYLEYILCLFIILNCRSIYLYIYDKNYRINIILAFVVMVLVITKFLMKMYDKKRIGKCIGYTILYYIYCLIFVIFNDISEDIDGFIGMFLFIFPLLFVYYFVDKNPKEKILEILRKISNVVVIIAIISLILYTLGPLLNLIKPTGTVISQWTGNNKEISEYFGLQFITQKVIFFNTTLIRNTGMFAEAPMYSLVLTIALAIEIFLNKKKSNWKKSILIITILTTASTTGIIITIIMLGSLWMTAGISYLSKKKDKWRFFIILVIGIIAIVATVFCLFLFKDKIESASGKTRLDDYKACSQAWNTNKLFGVGYGNSSEIQKYMSSFRNSNTGLSNSICVVLAQGGIYFFILYILPIYEGISYGIRMKDTKISIFTVIMLILFVTTIFQYTAVIVNFLVIGYVLLIDSIRTK